MALKLQVPWSTDHIQVDEVTDEILDGQHLDGPHVERCGGDVIVKNFFGMNNKVPDVSRYHIGPDGTTIRHCDISGQVLRQALERQQRNIVLLLESPHKDEYCKDIIDRKKWDITKPQAPACGSSGRNIERCLDTVLRLIQDRNPQLIEPGRHIIISNPIQFQTSLHAIHGQPVGQQMWNTLRDNVWMALWSHGAGRGRLGYIQLYFRVRLITYTPSLIINACTGEQEDSCSLKYRVNEFFQEGRQERWPGMILYNVGHPASWRRNDCSRIVPVPIDPEAVPNAGNQQ